MGLTRKRVMVIGGAGFLSSHLRERLFRDGATGAVAGAACGAGGWTRADGSLFEPDAGGAGRPRTSYRRRPWVLIMGFPMYSDFAL
jgi:hypothetical protein